MRKTAKYPSIVATAIAVFVGCGDMTENLNAEQHDVSEVEVSPASITIKEGESYMLTGKIRKWNATAGRSLVWASSDETKVLVADDGKVTGVGVGSADITASVGSKSAVSHVKVVSSRIPAESVIIGREQLILTEGTSTILSATIIPDNSTDRVVWSSSNPEIVSIGADGKAKATGCGYAEIIATAGDVRTSIKALSHGNLWISQLDALTKPVMFEEFHPCRKGRNRDSAVCRTCGNVAGEYYPIRHHIRPRRFRRAVSYSKTLVGEGCDSVRALGQLGWRAASFKVPRCPEKDS